MSTNIVCCFLSNFCSFGAPPFSVRNPVGGGQEASNGTERHLLDVKRLVTLRREGLWHRAENKMPLWLIKLRHQYLLGLSA